MKENVATARLSELTNKYNSAYARIEVLKLKSSNRDEKLIRKKQMELAAIEKEIAKINNALSVIIEQH